MTANVCFILVRDAWKGIPRNNLRRELAAFHWRSAGRVHRPGHGVYR